jgi:hypothetical protein
MKKKLIEFDWKVMAFKSVPLITIYKKAHVSVENPLRQSSTFITCIWLHQMFLQSGSGFPSKIAFSCLVLK